MSQFRVLLVTAVLASASPVFAAPCSDLPNPIYGLGGSASKPLLAKVSKALAALPLPDTATIVFQAPGACLGIYGILNNQVLTGTASFWDSTGVEQSCDLGAGQPIEFANMANSAVLCSQAPNPLPADVGDYEGPINTVNFIVNVGSSQNSISAAAAYFVFGFGAAGLAAPWTNDTFIIIRDANSAVQQLAGLAVGVPADKFAFGVNGLNQSGVITKVATGDTEAAIGFVSGEAADAARASVRTLAYQHTGQSCGYTPDSTTTAFDKRNVRDGHYFIWTPQHFFAKKDGQGVITSPGARRLIGYFTGAVPLPAGLDLLKIQINASTIPKCAMRVSREGDLGALHTYKDPKSCHSYFDSLTGGTTAEACTTTGPACANGGSCNYGYCEAP